MSHYLHYVVRRIATPDYKNPSDPYFVDHQPDDQGLFRPAFHDVPGGHGLAGQVKVGDYIWVFSQLTGPWGSLPPALDMLVVVEEISDTIRSQPKPEDDEGEQQDQPTKVKRFLAGEGSRWFPLFDASNFLKNKPLVKSQDNLVPIISGAHTHVGQSLRVLRKADDPAPLLAHVQAIEKARNVFVSYRLTDGSEAAFARAHELLNEGNSVFWDRWSLPRRLAERREFLNDAELASYIEYCIGMADTVEGISSPEYAEPTSYSYTEWELANQLGKFVS
jgi:hypothetical protein